jgi:oxygen-independent coproporphyrinogen-3 oxidase
MVKSCYIHIPFCKSICSYCDFPKVCYQKKWIKPYLDALSNEIKTYYRGDILKTIYIGGGTPLALEEEQLEQLFKIIDSLKKETNIEYTIEGNIDNITKEKIELLKKYGINRVSLGVETFNQQLLKELNRTGTIEEVTEKVNLLKENGITNINLDFMYAISDDISIVEDDLSKILSLDVPHISTYSLILEEHTLLKINNKEYISEEIDAMMYETIGNTLKEHGYIHYEVSNFAKPSYESKHNLTYWHNEEYYGFGLGAAGYIKDRYENTRNLNQYINQNLNRKVEEIDDKLKKEYELILNLRTIKGINKNNYKEKYHTNIEDDFNIEKLLKQNLLEEKEEYLRIPEDKIYLSNEILINFIT